METQLGQIPCSVEQFVQTIFLLREDRKARVRELGFASMLSIPEVKLRKSLLRSIIECYDPIEDKVTFESGQSFSVLPPDVDIIMGLPNMGNLVQTDVNIITPEDIPAKFKTRYNADGICIRDLVSIMYEDAPPNDDFNRSFVLYLMGTILAPVSRDRIPIIPTAPDSPTQRSCTHPDQTFHLFRLIIQPCTKQMADRPMLVQISCEKDDSPNRFSKGTVKEEVLDSLIPIRADIFLTTFPIFPS
jgi:hypothetical protein